MGLIEVQRATILKEHLPLVGIEAVSVHREDRLGDPPAQGGVGVVGVGQPGRARRGRLVRGWRRRRRRVVGQDRSRRPTEAEAVDEARVREGIAVHEVALAKDTLEHTQVELRAAREQQRGWGSRELGESSLHVAMGL